MFSGIISKIGEVQKAETKAGSLYLTIKTSKGWKLKPGDSVATDGVCLTVKTAGTDIYITELMPETLQKTYFSKIVPKYVNLERPLKLSSLLDGHLVLGHVDAVGQIKKIEARGDSKIYFISFPKKFSKLLVEKGSVAVDGISLTVVKGGQGIFSVAVIDYTLKNTSLKNKKINDLVNLEFDIIGKYVLGR